MIPRPLLFPKNPRHNGGMKQNRPVQPRCRGCGRFFRPDSRVKLRQKYCSKKTCQKKRKKIQELAWIAADEDYYKRHYEDVCRYRKLHPNYQKELRAKKRGEMQTQIPPANPLKSIRIHLRGFMAIREMQTQILRITQSGSTFWVDGIDMQASRDANADSGLPSPVVFAPP